MAPNDPLTDRRVSGTSELPSGVLGGGSVKRRVRWSSSAFWLTGRMNDWSPGYGGSVVPHGPNGAVQATGDFSNSGANGASSVNLGATGGNIGALDGSVKWLGIKSMKLRRGSQQYNRDGCWAMW